MKILAIDPGYERCGVAILERTKGKPLLVFSDCIITHKSLAFGERLNILHSTCEQLLKEYTCASVALERLYFNTNQKTAMRVAEVRGMFIQLASDFHLPTAEYTPPQIKLAVGGSGRASKEDVARMVSLLIHLPEKKRLDDEFDAIAIGLTHLACTRSS